MLVVGVVSSSSWVLSTVWDRSVLLFRRRLSAGCWTFMVFELACICSLVWWL